MIGLLTANPRALLALALCAGLGAGGWYLRHTGYQAGYAASEQRTAAATAALNERLDVAQAHVRRLTEEAADRAARMADLERTLADEAADDASGDIAVPFDSQRLRLNRIK